MAESLRRSLGPLDGGDGPSYFEGTDLFVVGSLPNDALDPHDRAGPPRLRPSGPTSSQPGAGSAFTIFFPREVGAAVSRELVKGPEVCEGHETILVAEDEEIHGWGHPS